MRGRLIVGVVMSLVIVMGWPRPAYAYIDPGTGSMLLQGLIAVVAGAAVTVRLYWRRIQTLIGRSPEGGSEADASKRD